MNFTKLAVPKHVAMLAVFLQTVTLCTAHLSSQLHVTSAGTGGLRLTARLPQVLRLRMSGAVTPLPLYIFVACPETRQHYLLYL